MSPHRLLLPQLSHLQRSFSAADESVPWMPERETREQLWEIHSATHQQRSEVFAALGEGSQGVITQDFHAETRALRLSPQYTVTYNGHRDDADGERGPSAAAWITPHSGRVSVTQDGETRTLRPGDSHYYTDDSSVQITSDEGAEVIHTVSPPQMHGRTLLLPPTPPQGAITEEKRKPFHAGGRRQKRAEIAARVSTLPLPSRHSVEHPHTAVFVHAHPDDDASKGPGTMRALTEQGWRVFVVHLTDGEQGSLLNPSLEDDGDLIKALATPRDTAAVRRKEADEASHALGFTLIRLSTPEWGMRTDTTTSQREDPSVVENLTQVLRELTPTAVFAYGENHSDEMSARGTYGHKDHERVTALTQEAVQRLKERGQRMPEVYEHMPHTLSDARWTHKKLRWRGMRSPYTDVLHGKGNPDHQKLLHQFTKSVTHRVNVAPFMQSTRKARNAYATQISPYRIGADSPYEQFRRVQQPEKRFRWPLSRRSAFEKAGAQRVWRAR